MTFAAVPDRQQAKACAVVWINGRRASLAAMDGDGQVSTCEIERGSGSEPEFLATVVRAIGERARVVVLGPGSMRLALEREYVGIHHRPDRLVDVEPARGIDRLELLRRLRELAA